MKRLFTLPLQGSKGEALCLHRVGNCLVVLDAAEERSADVGVLHAGAVAAATYPPRTSALRCQVQVEGDMVRMYPRTETAEPMGVAPPPSAAAPAAACCEWRVREGLSLVAVVPRTLDPKGGSEGDPKSGSGGILDFRPSSQWMDRYGRLDLTGPSLYQRHASEHVTTLVTLGDEVETEKLIDAWLSCSLIGSPSLLCFFADSAGLCRGCRLVAASEIPSLNDIARAFCADLRCLAVRVA